MPWGGPYVQTSWVSGTTPLSQPNMLNLETQYQLATQTFEQDLFTPFVLTGLVATKDGTIVNQLDVTTGVAFLLQTDSTVARQSIASSAGPLTTSAHTATYFLDLNPNGTYSFATTHSGTANYLPIAQVTTDSSGNISVVTDKRNFSTSMFVNGSSTGVLSIPGALSLGIAETGSQSEIFYTHANAAVAYNSPQAGAGPWGHVFGTWSGSALVVPFSIGGQFISALSWVDNSGNHITTGFLSMGATEGGSRSQIFYSHANASISYNTPQAGTGPWGHAFATWTGAAQAVPWSIGGQFVNAASFVDNTGALTLGAAVKSVTSQATAGSFGVPVIVAQVQRASVTTTGLQAVLTTGTLPEGLYRINAYVWFGQVATNALTLRVEWTDRDAGAVATAFMATYAATNNPLLLNAVNTFSGKVQLPITPLDVYIQATTTMAVKFNDPAGTPADFVTVVIERLM